MKAKGFFIAAVTAAVACLAGLFLLVAVIDPLFAFDGIEEGETAVFENQRYEMAGLIQHQDYSAVVMGTSLVANYRASWFTDALGTETLKITFPDGWVTEFDAALNLAFQTHPGLEQVYFCFDPNILIRSDGERTVELPQYLYNTNPLDDVAFYLNADSMVLAARTLRAGCRNEGTDLDSAYVWDENYRFDRIQAFASYVRPEQSDAVLPADAYYAVCEENLTVVTRWLEEHPDTQFTIWFPPYSILYWDKMAREGKTEAVISAVEYAMGRLLEYDNVKLHCFLFSYGTMCGIDEYTDHIHCSGKVTRWVADEMLAGRWQITEENYKIRLDELRGFVANYDYDGLFKANGKT